MVKQVGLFRKPKSTESSNQELIKDMDLKVRQYFNLATQSNMWSTELRNVENDVFGIRML